MFDRVVVALKPFTATDQLIELARSAAGADAEIHLISLVSLSTSEDPKQRLEAVQDELRRHAKGLVDAGFSATSRAELVDVMTGHRITELAGEREADLIVIGLSKRSRVGKALLGSDAQSVLLTAECPVLSARNPS